jgi:hypothetical protein
MRDDERIMHPDIRQLQTLPHLQSFRRVRLSQGQRAPGQEEQQ